MSQGITATVVAPVAGLFANVADGLAARNAFTDALVDAKLCEWSFSEGGMYEWTCGFARILDPDRFQQEAIARLQKSGVRNISIILRDGESPQKRQS